MDRARIAQAVEARQAELRKTWINVRRDGGPDQSTTWKVRQGRQVSGKSLRRLDAGLDWPAGTLEAIGRGEVAPPTTSDGTTDPAVVALLTEMRDTLAGLSRHLGVASIPREVVRDGIAQRRAPRLLELP